MTDTTNPNDSKTNVDIQKIRFSDKLTVRCDPEVKKALKQFSRQTGITECQILHALLTAYLHGMTQKISHVDKSPTINLTIERSVQRVRRYARESVLDIVVETHGSPSKCALCDIAAFVKGHFYSDDFHCSTVYLCREHWNREKVKPLLRGYAFV